MSEWETSPDGQRAVDFISRLSLGGDYTGQPFRLQPFQEQIVRRVFGDTTPEGLRNITDVFIFLPRGQGKALAIDTPIPSPGGWKTMGELKVGDEIFDERGIPCSITYATEVMHDHECYEVTFSDSSSIIADADHIWQTTTRKPENKTSLWTTSQIRETLKNGSKQENNHSLPKAMPLRLPNVDLPIEPYVLGVWLGDGNSKHGMIYCHYTDGQILAEVFKAGTRVEIKGIEKGLFYARLGRKRGFQAKLRGLQLLSNKHIPTCYLRASYEQRLALLQGLMDTDGSISDSQCSYDGCNEQLVRDVVELVRSLGLKCYFCEGDASIDGRIVGRHYRAQFYAFSDQPVFRLERKRIKQKVRGVAKTCLCETRKIKSVNPVPSVPVRCIQVDSPNHLFLAGKGMVATHNTEFIAALCVYILFGEGKRKQGQELYSAAADKEQAARTYLAMKGMIGRDPYLKTLADLSDYHKRIKIPKLNNLYAALASDGFRRHSLAPSVVVADELHAWKGTELWDALTSPLAKRKEPLTLTTTTAGSDLQGIAFRYYEYARDVRDAKIVNPSYLPVIYQADPSDDWKLEATWRKAMPALGSFSNLDVVRKQCELAKSIKSEEIKFKRYNLNMWTEESENWLNVEEWDECEGVIPDFSKDFVETVGSLDMSTNFDITSFSVLIKKDNLYYIKSNFWIPGDTAKHRKKLEKLDYEEWGEQGWVELTEGNAVDYRLVAKRIQEICEEYNVSKIAIDQYNATHTAQILQGELGIDIVKHSQMPTQMNAPSQMFEWLIKRREIVHDGNPLMREMIKNACLRLENELIKPVKPMHRGSIKRIDGVISAVMGLGLIRANSVEPSFFV